jgi:hypothetical protein
MAKKPVEVSWTKVAPIGRRRLNPYTGEFVQIGEPYILDSKKADMLSEMGEVEILEEDIVPPWAPKTPAPAPTKVISNEKAQA